jgi:alanine racemase
MNRVLSAETVSPELEAGGILTVDLAALTANWQLLGRRSLPAEVAAVVKADAYGCGLEPAASALLRAGCKTFFVASIGEGRRLRSIAPEAAIYVLNGFPPGTGPAFAACRLQPVIGNMAEMAEWDAFRTSAGWPGEWAVHVDTGMNRLGLSVAEASALAPRLERQHHGITLVMSHLVAAEIADHPLNAQQIEAFREIRRLFRGVTASLANSSGIFLGPAAQFDLVRPGVALYGANPTPSAVNPMQPVVELKARVIQVRTIQRDQTVGYDATWTARRTSRIAVVGIGYADGYLRAASAADGVAGGEAVVAGQRCPIAGRISMDLLALDVTEIGGGVRRGDFVTLLGDGIGVDDLAAFGSTIAYEVLTSLGRRYHRVYRTG